VTSSAVLVRKLYSWAADVPALRGVLDSIRSRPSVRAFARRRVALLLAPGTTWANLDGALRLLAEDPDQRIVFGPWRGDAALELLYWAPFVRWAQSRFAIDPARLTVLSRGGVEHWYDGVCHSYADAGELDSVATDASVFPPEPLLELVDDYRRGQAAPRPLLKRAQHVLLSPPDVAADARHREPYVVVDLEPSEAFPASGANARTAARLIDALSASRILVELDRAQPLSAQHAVIAGATGLVAAYSGTALLGAFSGVPVLALRSPDGDVAEPDVDLALRVTSGLGGSLTILDTGGLDALAAAIGGGRLPMPRAS
jgi:hypothetical protein